MSGSIVALNFGCVVRKKTLDVLQGPVEKPEFFFRGTWRESYTLPPLHDFI